MSHNRQSFHCKCESLEFRRLLANTFQVVDSVGDVGEATSLALNPISHRPAITYYDATNGDLKYVTLKHKRWIVDTIASDGDVGRVNALKFNSVGEPVVVFNTADDRLVLARQTRRRWSIQTIDPNGGRGVSLVLDTQDRPHVSYVAPDASWDAGDGPLYATANRRRWRLESITPVFSAEVDSFARTALALDSSGLPRIAYEASDGVGYASFDGSSWSDRIIVRTIHASIGTAPAIALGADDHPHISYGGEPVDASGIYYVTAPDETTFSQPVILPTGNFVASNDTGSTSVVIGTDGKPRVAYYGGFTEPSLRVATGESTNPNSFSLNILDSRKKEAVGRYPSMALDNQNNLFHVAYYDAVRKDLRYLAFGE